MTWEGKASVINLVKQLIKKRNSNKVMSEGLERRTLYRITFKSHMNYATHTWPDYGSSILPPCEMNECLGETQKVKLGQRSQQID